MMKKRAVFLVFLSIVLFLIVVFMGIILHKNDFSYIIAPKDLVLHRNGFVYVTMKKDSFAYHQRFIPGAEKHALKYDVERYGEVIKNIDGSRTYKMTGEQYINTLNAISANADNYKHDDKHVVMEYNYPKVEHDKDFNEIIIYVENLNSPSFPGDMNEHVNIYRYFAGLTDDYHVVFVNNKTGEIIDEYYQKASVGVFTLR